MVMAVMVVVMVVVVVVIVMIWRRGATVTKKSILQDGAPPRPPFFLDISNPAAHLFLEV